MQRPKLRPHIDLMRETLARVMGLDRDCVSIKATTTERLGFEGEERGVSAHAVALIYKA
jgi:2-C-methyl-D-erythritol 2,4-cyclodiphosphate synthase